MPMDSADLLQWGWQMVTWGIGVEPDSDARDWFMKAFAESAERLHQRPAFDSLHDDLREKLIAIGQNAAKLANGGEVDSSHLSAASDKVGRTPLCPTV